MSNKPIFVATHPRACSTAFERVFMTRRDILKCVHEPFGDAYYFGPERLAERYAHDEKQREKSGFARSTYHIIMERINQDNTEGKRLFIKDMAQYFFPPSHHDTSIAPSLLGKYANGVWTDGAGTPIRSGTPVRSGPSTPVLSAHLTPLRMPSPVNGGGHHAGHLQFSPLDADSRPTSPDSNGARFATAADWDDIERRARPASPSSPYRTFTEIENPTVVPTALLKQFHFTFLIRHPRYSIPSYYRCCIPPLDDLTGFHAFRPDEAGFEELRRFFDYCRLSGQVGPNRAGERPVVAGAHADFVDICLIDADDMLDDPEGVLSKFCASVGIDWDPAMLDWRDESTQHMAEEAFDKWKGFHEDAIHSHDLRARGQHRIKTDEELHATWVEKYGEDAARLIKKTVAENVEHYEYLKRFALRP